MGHFIPCDSGIFPSMDSMVSAGSGLFVYTRKLEDEVITVCINHGKSSAELPEIKGALYWSGGLNEKTLEASGFAVFSSCEA